MQVNFGKTFIVGFEGAQLNDEIAGKLREIDPAGIILYDTNIKERKQLQKLIADLKNLLGKGLLISVDQEGGKVERLRRVSSSLPSMQALGRASLKLGENQGLPFAREPIMQFAQLLAANLHELGFNFVYAPCADLATNKRNPIIGTRSLGANAAIVSEQIKIISQELRHGGIIPCIKHFPGHGDTSKDSHLELPLINCSLQEYFSHLKPFIDSIHSGIEAIMIAHVLVRLKTSSDIEAIAYDMTDVDINEIKELNLSIKSKDQDLPTSISPQLIEEELRTTLHYRGAVLSDEITMKALSSYGNYTEISEKMLSAGINLIIWNSNLDDALRASRSLNALDGKRREKLLGKYHFSLEKIRELKASVVEPLNHHSSVEELEEKMLEICEVSLRGDLTSLRATQWRSNPDIFVFNHPKLEPEVFTQVFKQEVRQFSQWSDIEKQLNVDKPILLFSFQTANNPDERKAIEKLRSSVQDLIVISTDQEDAEADIHLYAANRVHLEAFMKVMGSCREV